MNKILVQAIQKYLKKSQPSLCPFNEAIPSKDILDPLLQCASLTQLMLFASHIMSILLQA